MKLWLGRLFLLLTSPAAAQRPTAEAVKPAVSFWPINYPTGTVVFTVPTSRPLAPALAQAEHLRAWLTSTGSTWTELQTQADSTQLYQGQLHGVHQAVQLYRLLSGLFAKANYDVYRNEIAYHFAFKAGREDDQLPDWVPYVK